MQEMQIRSLGWEDSLEEEMATYSSIPAWDIHGQRSLVGYSLWGHRRVGHDLATKQRLFWTDWHLLWLVGIYGIQIIKYFEYYPLDRQTQNIIKWKDSGGEKQIVRRAASSALLRARLLVMDTGRVLCLPVVSDLCIHAGLLLHPLSSSFYVFTTLTEFTPWVWRTDCRP